MRFLLASLLVLLFINLPDANAATSLPARVKNFVLVDEGGAALLKSSALGVVIGISPDAEGWELCSAVHLAPGKAFTAAHCFEDRAQDWKYFVLFNDKQSHRVTQEVSAFLFQGDQANDIMVFSVPGDVAKRWQTIATGVDKFPAHGEQVTLWSFTPIDRIPELRKRFAGRSGMALRPNRCLASQTRPSIELRGAKGTQTLAMLRKVETEGHFFLDDCNYPVVDGNSGSLITSGPTLEHIVGILSLTGTDQHDFWESLGGMDLLREGTRFYFHGLDDKVRELTPSSGEFALSAATLLRPLFDRKPALFTH